MDIAHAVREIEKDRSYKIIHWSITIGVLLLVILVGLSLNYDLDAGILGFFSVGYIILAFLVNMNVNLLSVSVHFEQSDWSDIWTEFFESLDKEKPINEIEKNLMLGRFIRSNSENELPDYINKLLDHPVEDKVENTLREQVELTQKEFDSLDLDVSFNSIPYYKNYHADKTMLERLGKNYENEEYEDTAFYMRKTLENSINTTLKEFGGSHRNDHRLTDKIGTLSDICDETHTNVISDNTIREMHNLREYANPSAHDTDRTYEKQEMDEKLNQYNRVQEKLVQFNENVDDKEKQEVIKNLDLV